MASERDQLPRKTVMLTITEACNLRCSYCYQTKKSKRTMDLTTAQDVIAYEFNNSRNFDELQFDLFGGEPALRDDFVVEIVEWTISQKFEKPFIFFLQTNGTLVHGDFKNWLRLRKEYICAGLSLDGRPETHNRNRSNSYDQIDIDFFFENVP